MPSQPNAVLGSDGARQLLRRATFAPTPSAVASFAGLTRQDAADALVDYTPTRFRPNHRNDIAIAHGKWVKYMLRTPLQLQEKMVLFLHDHFASGNDKVENPSAMSLQNRTFRTHSNGNFKELVKAINVDPAMMEYLDTVRNSELQPNENYARELMELFTLGVFDLNGKANYKQQDIVQIARAFTGWDYNYRRLNTQLLDYNHDYLGNHPERGPKEIFGTPRADGPGNVGGFAGPQSFAPVPGDVSDGGSEGTPEIGAVIDILFDHQDSDGARTVARFFTKKLLSYLCHADPSKTLIDEVIADANFATNAHANQWEIGALLKAIFINDAFYLTAAEPPFDGNTKKSIKWPIDYLVSTMRLLGMKLRGRYPFVGGANTIVYDQLSNMGQILFQPPSVFGWDWETSWISSTTLLARFDFATDLISARGSGGSTFFHPEHLVSTSLSDAGQIVDAALEVVAMTDLFDADERDALIDYVSDGSPMTPVDLTDYDTRNRKLNGLFGLILQSPNYQLQ